MKKLFKKSPKEYSAEQNSEFLATTGIPTATGYKRPSKFGNFGDYAVAVNQQRRGAPLAPSTGAGSNPYAQGVDNYSGASSQSANPYSQVGGSGDKYAGGGGAGGAGGARATNPYGSADSSRNDVYGGNSNNNRYGGGSSGYGGASSAPPSSSSNPYEAAHRNYSGRFGHDLSRTETTDSTLCQRNELFRGATVKPGAAGAGAGAGVNAKSKSADAIAQVDELFELPDDLEKDAGGSYGDYGTEQALDSEDEDVEAIKGQIRFTKQESVQSTRNALRLAAEAEESGRNTLGMLGAQGERIANTEQNLALAEIQNKHAEEKARELKTLNRSLLKPHVSNPFNSKRRAQEKEAQIRAQYQQDQIRRENRRQMAYASQQRVMNGLNGGQLSETALKYKKENASDERKKFQFEEDSEDEDLETEIDANLDGIHAAAKRLNKLALATNDEVVSQNERLDRIADTTDVLDVNVHLNTSRLASIR